MVELKKMNVAVLSSARGGGAGIAAKRVADALNLRDDVHVDFIDADALGARLPDDVAIPRSLSNRKSTDTHYTLEHGGYVRGWVLGLLERYDIINIHWSSYLIGISEIEALAGRGKPVLFTLHDFYYITGGCHYPAGCHRFEAGCRGCPQLDRSLCNPEIIEKNWKIKRGIFAYPNVHLAAPSAFLVNEAVRAGVLPRDRAHVLRNAYAPVTNKRPTKPTSPVRIVVIADSFSERRKGMQLAVDSLDLAWQKARELGRSFLVDFVGRPDGQLKERLETAKFPYVLHGRITDHLLIAKIYAEAHYLLTCSYEDNWPNVLVEAGSYGVMPIVGQGHGCEEFVRAFDGKIAGEYSDVSFAGAICEALLSPRGLEIRDAVTDSHSPARVAERYAEVFKTLTSCPSVAASAAGNLS